GHLAEEEAELMNRKGKSKHKPALPLFTEREARDALHYFEPLELESRKIIDDVLSFEFQYAGHILGAASVIIYFGESKIAFSGDLGRHHDRVFHKPELVPPVDYVVVESTYGNRRHSPVDP